MKKNLINFFALTIFPNIFDSYLNESIIKRAIKNKFINFKAINLRDYTLNPHKTVDDKPFGGGEGMLLKIEPIYRALNEIQKNNKPVHKILLSAKGKKFDQDKAKDLTKKKNIIFVCGRYEGVDERVKENLIDEEISIGNYVLTGGELPALIITDAITRLIPGVLGNEKSPKNESFSQKNYLEHPQYTRPENFNGWEVPSVLRSGNHKKIKIWKKQMSQNTKK